VCQIPASIADRNATLSIFGMDGSPISRYKLGASSERIQTLDFSKTLQGRYIAVLQAGEDRYSAPFVKF